MKKKRPTPAQSYRKAFSCLRGWFAVLLCCGSLGAQEAPDIRVEVNLVRVAVSATEHGIPVRGLGKDDFALREDAVAQTLKYFWREEDLPLSIGLIVDVSGSQAGLIGKHRESVTRFLQQVMGARDRVMLITVGPQARLITDFTSSVDELGAGIDHIRMRNNEAPILGEACEGTRRPFHRGRTRGRGHTLACGGTALWQGVYAAARLKMRGVEGRKALIIFSDGMDTGSDHSLSDAIEAAQAAETPVYTIKFVGAMGVPFAPLIALGHGMQKISDETGGLAFGMMHGNIGDVFANIEADLRNLYVLGYISSNAARDGKFRRIEVSCAKHEVRVRARTGYVVGRGE